MARKVNKNDEWAEIDLAGLGLDDPMAEEFNDEELEDTEESVEVIRRDITPNQVQKAYVEDGVEPQNPGSEHNKDWPKFKTHSQQYPQTHPYNTESYQEARSSVSAEDQKDIEPIVYDSPDGDILVPQRSIFAKTPTEDEAAHRTQQQPPRGTVMTIEERNMKMLSAMETAMGNHIGINMSGYSLGEHGMGKLSLKKFAPKNVIKQITKNPLIKATMKIGAAVATGGVSAVLEAQQIKKRKEREKAAAKKNAAANEAAKRAKEDENYIRSTTTINLDANGKKESATIMIPDYGAVTIPIKLYETTKPITGIFDAAVKYKTAQDTQAQLAQDALDLKMAADTVGALETIGTEQVTAYQNPSYTPSNPYSMTPQEVVQTTAPVAVNYMNNNNIPPTSQNITTVANSMSDAWVQQQQEQIRQLQAQRDYLQQQQYATQQAQQEMAWYVEQQGGTPKPPESLEEQRTEDYYPDFNAEYGYEAPMTGPSEDTQYYEEE